jgi:hypothetical protein
MGNSKKGNKPQRYHNNSHNSSYIVRTTGAVDDLMQEAFLSGYQKACDMLALTLHDPEVMGTNGVFGERRIVKVYEGMAKYDLKYRGAWKTGKEADYLQDSLDRELRAVFAKYYADQVVPFNQRHNLVFIPGYSKPRKGWV